MSTKLYDLAVVTSKYIDRNGNEKAIWKNIGSLNESEKNGKKSRFIWLDATFNPAGVEREKGSSSILISLFPPKDKQQQSEQSHEERSSAVGQAQNANNLGDFNNIEDVPF